MTLRRRSGGGWTDLTVLRRRSGGGWVDIQNLYKRQNGAWVKIWPTSVPITLSISPTSIEKTGLVANQTTQTATVTASGGSGAAKTYSWSWVTNPGGLTITSPSSNATTFSKSGMVAGSYYQGTARCTVSDGTSSAYIDIHVGILRDENDA